MKKEKTKIEKTVRSKIYDLIYYESLNKEKTPVTSAQLARIAKGGAR